MIKIQSAQNPNFKRWKSLLESRGIKKNGQTLVAGQKLYRELITHPLCQEVILPEASSVLDPVVLQAMQDMELPIYQLPSYLFKELDSFGTQTPLLILKTPELNSNSLESPPLGLELLCALSDPTNLGAVIRTAKAFTIKKVILLSECAHPFLGRSIRSSSGAVFHTVLEKGPSIQDIPNQNLCALDLHGENLANWKWPKDLRLLIGEEGQGVPTHLGGQRLQIPISPEVESLNAVSAASIALFSYSSFWQFI